MDRSLDRDVGDIVPVVVGRGLEIGCGLEDEASVRTDAAFSLISCTLLSGIGTVAAVVSGVEVAVQLEAILLPYASATFFLRSLTIPSKE